MPTCVGSHTAGLPRAAWATLKGRRRRHDAFSDLRVGVVICRQQVCRNQTHCVCVCFTIYQWFTGAHVCRVGQNHIYTVHVRYFWQGNHQIYGHIRCIYTVLANPTCVWRGGMMRSESSLFQGGHGSMLSAGLQEADTLCVCSSQ